MGIAILIALGLALAPAPAPAAAAQHEVQPIPKPVIRHRFIPLGEQRLRETRAYALRHYGFSRDTIADPRAIVEHYTVNDSVDATYETFAPDIPDVELHELPGTCAQFVIARDGTIVQLTPITFLCRHTVGLNWAAIGIEHVGYGEQEILDRSAQLDASLRLTRWLRCRYRIPVRDVIGHAESLSSRYHHEQVAALRTQTHSDWQPWAMRRYRALLRERGAC